jgi:NAD(P)-dependent dehydrogenase (short-subunit alcohol dehydrogenase family)
VPEPTVLVTGAGRGIGRATALRFLDAGWRVAAGVRDVEAAREVYPADARLRLLRLDLTDAASIRSAAAAAEQQAGGALACLVNNAAYAVLGAVEDVDLDATRRMFETNLFGAMAVIQAVLPAMREAGAGAVVNVSSIGARYVSPLISVYHASKAALALVSEGLALECRPFGIRVSMVEPGMVDTDFPRATLPTGRLAAQEGPYAPLLADMRRGFAAWRAREQSSAEAVAAAVLAAATSPRPPLRILVGADAERIAEARAELSQEDWADWLSAWVGIDWSAPR